MNKKAMGVTIRRTRTKARLTQAELASRMGTTQSVIARAEGGEVLPSLNFLERLALATGQRLVIELGPKSTAPNRRQRRDRVRRATRNFVFNPWDRDPTEAEAKSLLADGLTRERFTRQRAT